MSDNAGQTFSDIIRGMQHAVNAAQETLQEHQFYLMQRYFNTEDGSPHMMWITLPGGRRINVPQITLIPQSLLAIEELEMSFAVAVAHSEVKTFEKDARETIEKKNKESAAPVDEPARSSFQVAFARQPPSAGENGAGPRSTDTIEVKIKFKTIPIPEGASRVQDMLNLEIGEE
jgi:hypothetical protein